MTRSIDNVGVCGAGAMGSGIAQVAAQAGLRVTVYDLDVRSLTAGRERVETGLSELVRRQKLTADAAASIADAISWTDRLDALASADLVIEAIIEDAGVKQDLFGRLEAVVGPECVLATNTSSLPIGRLGRGLKQPERFIGMHFFNPATVMKLVEVIAGPATAPDIVDAVEQAATAWGKVAVRVADVPGFIVNRAARPFYAEAFRAWTEGVRPALIDHLFRAAGRFRMGPLELTDLIGQDVNFAVARSVYDSYFGRTRFVPQLAQAQLVDAGWLGRKTGRGVYRYKPVPESSEVTPEASVETAGGGPPLHWTGESDEIVIDGVRVRRSRGRTARAEAMAAGSPVAVLDWFGDDAAAAGFAASDDHAAHVAVPLLTRQGLAAFRLADRPGLVVLRTLAQIANAAGDAVLERVSDEKGIDAALRFGANYPVGPFAWADRLGRAALIEVLAGIAEATGDRMYHPSEHFTRTLP